MVRTTRTTKLALLVGYLAFLVAVLVAHETPARSYELSLYANTPAVTLGGLGLALLVSILVVLATDHRSRGFDAGRLLGASAGLGVLTLPILRGYTFYGSGDSLSHVGWAREIAAGTLSPGNLLYPGIHTLTVAIGSLGDVPLTQANMYVVLFLFPLLYVVFLPLTAAVILGSKRALGIGLLAALLFTPINNISVHAAAHPASQTILFLPFVLYLAFRYVTSGTASASDRESTAGNRTATDGGTSRHLHGYGFGVVLALTAVSAVLLHPQQALNIALCFAAITGFQLLMAHRSVPRSIGHHRILHLQTGVFVVAFAAWAPRFERVQGAFGSTIASIIGQGATAGNVVSAKSASVTSIGGSVPILFTKLFLPALVCSLLAFAVVLVGLRNRFGDRETTTFVRYLTMALVPVSGVFLVVLAAASGDMYFRYQGFIMVPVTILAVVALVRGRDWVGARTTPGTGTTLVLVVLLVLVPVGLVTAHSTPYVYQPTQHVPDSEIAGYANAFEHRAPGVPFTGLRSGPRRFVDLHYGTHQARTTLEFPGYEAGVQPAVFRNASYRETYDQPRYLAVTESSRDLEVALYRGFRYPAEGFQALERTAGVNRIRSNDGFDLYYIADSRGD